MTGTQTSFLLEPIEKAGVDVKLRYFTDYVSSIDALTAAPSVPQAGGHGDFSLSMNLSGTDHAKTLVIHLPAGLIGNPAAATPCSAARWTTCPVPTA